MTRIQRTAVIRAESRRCTAIEGGGVALAVLIGVFCVRGEGGAQAPQPRSPVVDKTIVASTTQGSEVQQGAKFGWTMSAGKLGLLFDNEDDLAVAAITHDLTAAPAPDIGAGFVYVNSALQPSLAASLLPSNSQVPPQAGAHLGQLGNAIGDVRGSATSPQSKLLFLGAFLLDTAYPACNANAADLGAVAIFDLNSGTPTTPVMLIPPKDGPGKCYPEATKSFGHSIAIADLDGDGTNDLIVGAHGSDPVPEVPSGKGRAYVFFGHSAFLSAASNPTDWIAIRAPADALLGESFGSTVVAGDLDGDGKAELIVGAAQRSRGPGRITILRGSTIAQWRNTMLGGGSHLFTPAPADFQRITSPLTGTDQAFSWTMTLGSLRSASPILDLAVYAENTQGFVDVDEEHPCAAPCEPVPPVETNERPVILGALFVYKNVATGTTGPLLEDSPFDKDTNLDGYFQVPSPFPSLEYAPRARFGRSTAIVKWAYTEGEPQDTLLVGEPGGYNHGSCQSGKIYLYELPLVPDANGVLPGPVWLAESPNKEACTHFGGHVTALHYDSSEAAQQIAVSQREETVNGSGEAGRVYTFRGTP